MEVQCALIAFLAVMQTILEWISVQIARISIMIEQIEQPFAVRLKLPATPCRIMVTLGLGLRISSAMQATIKTLTLMVYISAMLVRKANFHTRETISALLAGMAPRLTLPQALSWIVAATQDTTRQRILQIALFAKRTSIVLENMPSP